MYIWIYLENWDLLFLTLGVLKEQNRGFPQETCYNFGMGDWVSHFQTSVGMGQNGPKSLDGFHTQNAPNPGSAAISNGYSNKNKNMKN